MSQSEQFNGPIYSSWNEAMSDPDLDLGRPWAVAPPPDETEPMIVGPPDWSGWQTLEPIDETEGPR